MPFVVQLLDDVAEHRSDDADGIADSATGTRVHRTKTRGPDSGAITPTISLETRAIALQSADRGSAAIRRLPPVANAEMRAAS